VAWATYQHSEIDWKGTCTCYLDRLNEIKAPTLIVHGAADNLVPMACAQEAHARIAGSVLAPLENCGHWPQRDDPAGFMQAVNAFLDKQV
jgi:pimeloyl-ACP methyl ester carboxylesterase